MTLYHYTSIESFRKIWESKSLLFSLSENTNDFFERQKTITLTQETFVYNGKPQDRSRFDNFDDKIFREFSKYRQVSLSCDYSASIKGYESPMMWGQYARSKNELGQWVNGVCIAIDSDKIIRPNYKIFEGNIDYSSELTPAEVVNIDYTKEGAESIFVERHIITYFFTKHKHWEYENEYRFVSKYEGSLGIKDAIIGIYILDNNDTPKEEIKSIVQNDSLVYLVSLYSKEILSLQDIKDLQNVMDEFNRQNALNRKQ